jgi:hypothetical protein
LTNLNGSGRRCGISGPETCLDASVSQVTVYLRNHSTSLGAVMKKRLGNLLGSVTPSGSNRERRRRLGLEPLEGRRLLAADLGLPYHNFLIAEDTNRDFKVTPLDVLVVVNEVNRRGMGPLGDSEGEENGSNGLKFDVNGDNYLSALDILLVVNRLNAEGESGPLMGYSYQVTNLSGAPIANNSVVVGQEFIVNTFVTDLRPENDATGVFTASVDLGVTNLDLVQFIPANAASHRVQFGDKFQFFPAGGQGGGLQVGGDPTAANHSASNARVSDGQRFGLGSLVFEFDWDGTVESGNVPVQLPNPGNGALSFNTVVNAMVTAVNGSSLGVVARNGGQGVLNLPAELQASFDPLTTNLTWSDERLEYFNEITASTNALELSGPIGPTLFFSARFVAREPGQVTFTPNHKEFVFNENLLFGSPDRLPNDFVQMGSPFSVTILADPTAPVANNDTLTTLEDTSLTLVAATLLANDTVTAPRTLSLVSVDPISGVTVGTLNGLVYTPPLDFYGQDLLSYTIQDSTGLRATGTITINVTPVNDPPIAVNDNFVVVEDSVDELLVGVLNNDSGGPNEPDDVIRVIAVGTPNNGGSVRIAANQRDLIYTPAPGFIGTESFTYTIADQGNLTATATVFVEVEPLALPRARVDRVTVEEDTVNNVINVLANDRVNDGQKAILLSVTQPANGTVTIDDNGTPDDLTDDRVLYTPKPNFFGTDVFTYVMNDTLIPRGPDSVGTVTVTVNNVNDPVELRDDVRSATEDTVAIFSVASLLANDSPGAGEEDTQTLTMISVAPLGPGGTVELIGGNVIYTPAPDFNGVFRFTYTAQDDGIPVSTGTATVTVNVAAVNDDPIAGNDTVATNEDTVLNIPVATLLANDLPGPPTAVDEADQVLSIIGVSPTSARGGSVVLAGSTVTYTPAQDFFGTDTFTYTLSDGAGGTATGTVTVNVAPINDPPIPGTDEVVAFKDFPAVYQTATLLANDRPGPANESDQTLRITAVIATANTNGTVVLNADGTITYTPAPGYTGPASFQYRVEDSGPSGNGNVNFAIGTVNVTVQEFVPSVISGIVWVDETRDGIINANERRLGGVRVTLTGTSLGETITPVTVKTLADGSYDFPNLAPGQYTVSYETPLFMVDNANLPNSYTVSIVEPGGVNQAGNNFAVIGLDVLHARTMDQLASRYFMQDQSLIHNGAFFALAADGSLLWGSNLDGYAGFDFCEAALDGQDLLLTLVANPTRAVETARLRRGQYLTTQDAHGNTLVRVLGGRSQFTNWQAIDLASPPVVSPASRYLDAVDEIFRQEGW